MLQAEVEAHVGRVHEVLSSGQSLAVSGHPQAQHIVEQCQKLEGHWAELEQACEARAQCLQQAVTVQQVGDRGWGLQSSGSWVCCGRGELWGLHGGRPVRRALC